MPPMSDPQGKATEPGTAMAEIKNVTGTAFIVAEFRADENSAAEPLFRDEIVSLFLDDATKKAADGFLTVFPPIKQMIKVRTRYLDDRLDEQLRQGFRQVVVLGSGFDTRSIRKQTAGVNYFEIDDPGTLNFKKARLEANNIRAGTNYISGDYVSDDLNTLLESGEFDFSLPAHFIWEGNTMYLTADSVRQVMINIAKRVERVTLAFDYMAPEVIAKSTGDPAITALVESFAAMGAPWTFGIGNLQELARQAGMSILENRKTADLYRDYRPDGIIDTPLYGLYSLCTLEGAR
jgi:methyltransferase (TIGR00027 family)